MSTTTPEQEANDLRREWESALGVSSVDFIGRQDAREEIEARLASLIGKARQCEALRLRAEKAEAERDEAINMLAAWCVAIERNGAGWDDWDEHYKNASHRPCSIRALIDSAIAKEKKGADRG